MTEQPELTVVVPAYNEADTIATCVKKATKPRYWSTVRVAG